MTTDSYHLLFSKPLPLSDTGAANLLVKKGLADTYRRTARDAPVAEGIAAHSEDIVDGDIVVGETEKERRDFSLRELIDRPPIGGEVIKPLEQSRFVLKPGRIPEADLQRIGRDAQGRLRQSSGRADGAKRER